MFDCMLESSFDSESFSGLVLNRVYFWVLTESFETLRESDLADWNVLGIFFRKYTNKHKKYLCELMKTT